jgi:surface antigen
VRGGLARAAATGAAVAFLLIHPAPASAASSQAVRATTALTRPDSLTKPPADHFLNALQATRIASGSSKLREELRKHDHTTHEAFAKGPGRWQVSWYADGNEVGQVIVDERTRRAVEVWTGPQAAWQMARGLPGAFGRKVNSPAVWIPMMVAFFLPFFDWRRPFRLLHLDLLVLLSFSLSHVFFNKGDIDASVPLVYPPLAYLLVRMLLIAYARGRAPPQPLRLLVPVGWLAIALVFLIGFRIGLNATNSNVIDVGYSGVIGADRLTHGDPLYGQFPSDDPSGDTYGPVAYYAYIPFEQAFPWSGSWDDLATAHAAALFFDVATILALLWVGRRLRRGREGTMLGVVLAYAWASFPYTLFVSNSNSNDALVALLVVLSFGALAAARARGALLALASATKFAPLVLLPLFASYDRRRVREAALLVLAFVAVTIVVFAPVIPDGGISKLWDRTVGFQLGRDSPFSIWGQHPGLDWLQSAAKAGLVVLAFLVALVPREKTPLQLAALAAAVLIALQLTMSHWFYLYIVWWFPLVMLAILFRETDVVGLSGSASGEAAIYSPRARESARSSSRDRADPTSPDTPSPRDLPLPSRTAPASASRSAG